MTAISSHELAWRLVNLHLPTSLGFDDKLQRLLAQSCEILRIESPLERNDLWEEIIKENGMRTSNSPDAIDGFVTARNPKHGISWPKDKIDPDEFVLLPEDLAMKMRVLACPLLRSGCVDFQASDAQVNP